jgi:response regulator of citrate/malate metabolism
LESLVKFIKDSNVLIITNNQNTKMSLKKIFTEYGIASARVLSAEGIEAGERLIAENESNFLILDAEINEKSTRDLIEVYIQKNPIILNRIICLMGADDSEHLKLEKLEYDYDHLFIAPFTYNNFKTTIEKLVKSKTKMGEFEKVLYQMNMKLEEEEFELVKEFLDKFDDKGITDPRFELFRAKYFFKIGLFEEAVKTLESVLEAVPDNYKAHTKLFDIYMDLSEFKKAHALAQEYLKYYAFHPKRIDKYIKCTLISKQYQELLAYGLKIEPYGSIGESAYKALGAGMIIAANELAGIDPTLAVQAAEKALKFSDFKPNIYAALNVMIKCKNSSFVRRYIEALEEHEIDNQIKILELRAIDLEESPKNIYTKGMDLLQNGVVDFSVYDIIIRCAIKIGRKKESIQEQVEDATKHFPDKKDYFSEFL